MKSEGKQPVNFLRRLRVRRATRRFKIYPCPSVVEMFVLLGVLGVFVVILFRFENAAKKNAAAGAGPEFQPPARAGAMARCGSGTPGKNARHTRPHAPGRGGNRQGLE